MITVDATGRASVNFMAPPSPPPAAPTYRPLEVIELELLEAKETLTWRLSVHLPAVQASLEDERAALGDVNRRLADLNDLVCEAMTRTRQRQAQQGDGSVQATWFATGATVSGPAGWSPPRDAVLEAMTQHKALQDNEWAPANRAMREREADLQRLTTWVIPGLRRLVDQLQAEYDRARTAAEAAEAAPEDPAGVRSRLAAVRARLGLAPPSPDGRGKGKR